MAVLEVMVEVEGAVQVKEVGMVVILHLLE